MTNSGDQAVSATDSGIRAIVAGHGSFAAGIISAVDQITGQGAQFASVSNAGLCLDDIQATLARALDETGARVIFTDLPAGSCTMAVRRMIRERPGVLLVTGVNLSVLLDFAMQPDADLVRAVQTALDRGRAAMVVHGR
jgi:mannose/fructose-specific phosphotransferase system component IIA